MVHNVIEQHAPGCVSDLPARRPSRWRSPALLAVAFGLGVILARRHDPPTPAPEPVQREGHAQLRRILGVIEGHACARTARGEALCRVVHEALAADEPPPPNPADRRIQFTVDLPGRAALRRTPWGRETWYIMVLEMADGRHLLQLDDQTAEVLFHEAVHALRDGHGRASFEEECDAYAAGAVAEAIVRGRPVPALFTMDAEPIASFVARRYPHQPRDPDYAPVGLTRAALLAQCGPSTP